MDYTLQSGGPVVKPSLQSMPIDPLIEIFSYLDFCDLRSLAKTCRSINGATTKTIINRAKLYGYTGEGFTPSILFLKNILGGLKTLLENGYNPKQGILVKNRSFFNSSFDVESTYQNLRKEALENELKTLFPYTEPKRKKELKILIQHKNNPNKIYRDPLSLCEWALANSKSFELISWLIDHGSDIKQKHLLHTLYESPKKTQLLLEKGANVDAQNPLHLASKNGILETVRILLNHQANPNLIDFDGNTPLHLIVERGDYNIQLVTLLLQYNANPNLFNQKGYTPLHLATRSPELTELFLKKGAAVDLLTRGGGSSALHIAARENQYETVKVLLEGKADPNLKNGRGETPLHLAVAGEFADAELVKLLLEHGADPNLLDGEGTPIICKEISHPKITKILLKKGAIADKQTKKEGNSALHIAALRGDLNIAKILLKFGANLNLKNQKKKTPLHLSIGNRRGLFELLPLLLRSGAKINEVDQNKDSSLHLAAKLKLYKQTEMLLQKNANPNLINSDGKTPLHLAMEGVFNKNLVILLLKHDADPNIQNLEGYTPLMIKRKKSPHLITLLLKHGCNPDLQTSDSKQSALHFPEYFDSGSMQILLSHGADPNLKDHKGETPLFRCIPNHLEHLSVLLMHKADPNIQNLKGDTLLHKAARMDESEYVESLLKYEANFDLTNQEGKRPIDVARNGPCKDLLKNAEAFI